MNHRFFLSLIALVLFLSIVLLGVASWKFLLASTVRSREVNIEFLELPEVNLEGYNALMKKGQ